jgi:uncharacterized protein YndB with AHSA1/START domain
MAKTIFKAEPGSHEMSMERVFDAAPDRVYAAYTDPKLIGHWWGPRQHKFTAEKLEARAGGLWRFILNDPSGTAHPFRGVYHEAIPGQRLVHTFMYEGAPGPGNVSLETVLFEDLGGKTRVTAQSVFQSIEARDAMMENSGGEAFATDAWDRLEEIATR